MTTRITPDWQRRRASFNHDWLKNQYMPALAKCLNLLDDRIEDPQFEQVFVTVVLPQWESHYTEVLHLLQSFQQEMSPRALVSQMGFCGNGQGEHWLAEVMHHIWLARYPVRQWVEQALARAHAADAAYKELQESLSGCSDVQSAEALRPLRDTLAAFRDRCQDLAKAVEQFPSEIKVT